MRVATGENGGGGLWVVERVSDPLRCGGLHARRLQQNTGTQLLATGDDTAGEVEGGRRRREGSRPCRRDVRERGRAAPTQRLAVPRTVSCRALFLAFLIHQCYALVTAMAAVLEEERAGVPGQVHPGHPCAPEGDRKDDAAGAGRMRHEQ